MLLEEQKFTKERIDTQYFIDTEGRIHKWKGTIKEAADWNSLHSLIADKKGTSPDVLHNLGWIMIGAAAYGTRIKGEPTQAQINTLFDMGRKRIRDSYGVLYQW